jgi:hypothetical protein
VDSEDGEENRFPFLFRRFQGSFQQRINRFPKTGGGEIEDDRDLRDFLTLDFSSSSAVAEISDRAVIRVRKVSPSTQPVSMAASVFSPTDSPCDRLPMIRCIQLLPPDALRKDGGRRRR